jgi:hypothetical protein
VIDLLGNDARQATRTFPVSAVRGPLVEALSRISVRWQLSCDLRQARPSPSTLTLAHRREAIPLRRLPEELRAKVGRPTIPVHRRALTSTQRCLVASLALAHSVRRRRRGRGTFARPARFQESRARCDRDQSLHPCHFPFGPPGPDACPSNDWQCDDVQFLGSACCFCRPRIRCSTGSASGPRRH